jgi:hypothetical protein
VAPADGKAVAAIEKLIGQSINWMGEPPRSGEAPVRADSRPDSRPGGRKGNRGRQTPSRPERAPSSVTRIDQVRPHRPPSSPPKDVAGDHLPAFLLRPTRVKV